MTASPGSRATGQVSFVTPSFFELPTPGAPVMLPTQGTATTMPGQLTGSDAMRAPGPTTVGSGKGGEGPMSKKAGAGAVVKGPVTVCKFGPPSLTWTAGSELGSLGRASGRAGRAVRRCRFHASRRMGSSSRAELARRVVALFKATAEAMSSFNRHRQH